MWVYFFPDWCLLHNHHYILYMFRSLCFVQCKYFQCTSAVVLKTCPVVPGARIVTRFRWEANFFCKRNYPTQKLSHMAKRNLKRNYLTWPVPLIRSGIWWENSLSLHPKFWFYPVWVWMPCYVSPHGNCLSFFAFILIYFLYYRNLLGKKISPIGDTPCFNHQLDARTSKGFTRIFQRHLNGNSSVN